MISRRGGGEHVAAGFSSMRSHMPAFCWEEKEAMQMNQDFNKNRAFINGMKIVVTKCERVDEGNFNGCKSVVRRSLLPWK